MDGSVLGRLPMEDGAPGPLPQRAYMQVAMYASGNALAALVGLLLWNVYGVLADYRDAAIYALLCSVALRPAKTWLVHYLADQLAHKCAARGAVPLRRRRCPCRGCSIGTRARALGLPPPASLKGLVLVPRRMAPAQTPAAWAQEARQPGVLPLIPLPPPSPGAPAGASRCPCWPLHACP